jgi:hypothetical protein
MSATYRACPEQLLRAAAQDTPAFLDNDVARSSPAHGSPYLVGEGDLLRLYGTTPRRRAALDGLLRHRQALAGHCRVHAVLVGGSTTRPGSGREPRDCDAVVFYSLDASAAPDAIDAMAAALAAARAEGLDLRLVPTDGDPVDLIKAVAYFSLLFSAERNGTLPRFGSLLLVQGDH